MTNLAQGSASFRQSLAILSGAFFLWGVLRSLNDLLIALFLASGGVSNTTVMLIHFSFFSAYLLISIPAGIYVRRHGYRPALTGSILLMAAGSALCVPAVYVHSLLLCTAGIFVIAMGIASLQTAGNACLELLGPEETAAARLLLVQSFCSMGSILGPLAGAPLFGTWSRIRPEAALHFPNRMLAAIYALLTVTAVISVQLTRRYFPNSLMAKQRTPATMGMGRDLLRRPQILFGVAAAFLYVGSEATLLGNCIPYLSRHFTNGFLPATSAMLLSVYWACVMTGRVLTVKLLRDMPTRRLLQGACATATLLIGFSLYRGGTSGGIVLLLTGLCNAVMFPSIFSLTVAGLREEELPQASGFLTTAMCGGALMPVLSGVLADRFDTATAFLLPCSAYILIGIFSAAFFPQRFSLRHSD